VRPDRRLADVDRFGPVEEDLLVALPAVLLAHELDRVLQRRDDGLDRVLDLAALEAQAVDLALHVLVARMGLVEHQVRAPLAPVVRVRHLRAVLLHELDGVDDVAVVALHENEARVEIADRLLPDRQRAVARQLDEIDFRIIAELKEDGRQPNSAIARKLGVSEAAVRGRVARLLQEKAIRITIITNAAELGYVTGDIRVRVPHERLEEIATRLTDIPEVDYVMVCTGRQNLIVSVVCVDLDQLHRVVADRISAIDDLEMIDVSVNLQVAKATLIW